MSAFLGPIHYWLYNKIQLQEQMVEDIITLARIKGIEGLDEKLNSAYGNLERAPLEEIIDENNIHGWLQSQVSKVEYRLADSVVTFLKETQGDLSELEEVFYRNGQAIGTQLQVKEDLNLSQVYKGISDSLLDGMPCDHAIQLLKNEPDEVIWKRAICVHTPYWEKVGGNISCYYHLRNAWINGLAQALGIHYSVLQDDMYRLSRGEMNE